MGPQRFTSGTTQVRTVLALLIAACLVGCRTPGAGIPRDDAALRRNLELLHGGVVRTYDLYVPVSPAGTGRRLPLVVLLHGHGGSADNLTGADGRRAPHSVWMGIADRHGAVLLMPDGVVGPDGRTGWNDCRSDSRTNPGGDDVGYLDALADEVAARLPVDLTRVFVAGTSNGGHMSLRWAQERPRRVRAAAAIVAAQPAADGCEPPARAIPVLFMNGTEDPLVPFAGGPVAGDPRRGTVLSADASVQRWVSFGGGPAAQPAVDTLPDRMARDGSIVVRELYPSRDAEVVLYRVIGGGHTEPSRLQRYRPLSRPLVGTQNGDIEMADAVWAFFRRHGALSR